MKHQHSSNTLLQGVFSHPYQVYYLIFFSRFNTERIGERSPIAYFYRAHDDVSPSIPTWSGSVTRANDGLVA